MNTINITIENTVMHPDSVVAGYAGDNLTTTLSIELPDSWRGYSYRLLFKTSMQDYNDAYITDTIQPEGGHILFPLPSAVMVEGKLQVQARAEKDSGEIAHAAVMSLDVLHSIGTSASGDFPPSYVGLMDNALNHLLSLGAWYPPKIVDGYWWAYDATADDYANTGVNAQGLNSVTEETETALTGILKGNGETVVQAVAGTDYAIPEQVNAKQNTITAQGILKGDGSGGVSTAAAGTDYATPAQLEGKLDKTGGTISGALTVSGTLYANSGIGLPTKNAIIKTTAGGLTTGATAGTDYEQVTIGGTTDRGYAKFASGLLVCWGNQGFGTQSTTTAWGNLYEGPEYCIFSDFAYAFSAAPAVTAIQNYRANSAFFVEGIYSTTATSPGKFIPVRPNPASVTVAASYIAIGRWK